MRIVLTTDGSSEPNPGKTRIGAVLQDTQGTVIGLVSEPSGYGTSNTAEYTAILRGLQECARHGATHVTVYTDSQLVCHQLEGVFNVKNTRLKGLHKNVLSTSKRFTRVRFRWHSREEGMGPAADSLAKGGKAAAEVYEQLAETS